MFVRIIRGPQETTYDCRRAEFTWLEDLGRKKGDVHLARVVMDLTESQRVVEELEFNPDTQVIYMSNDGKTIDRKVM